MLFPLSLSFAPAIAASSSNSSSMVTATEPYTLGVGESVATIAKKYGISLEELKEINNYRTFAKPFTALTVGDEIDVPRKTSPFSVDKQINQTAGTPLENRFASHAQAGATALSAGNVAKSGERMVRSAANSEFNSAVQDWLSQFGTAQVQLNVNDNFKLDGSALDVLVPLYDNQNSLLFSQLGVRNKDSRNTVNIGAGVRTFHDNWMYGANTFFDNDITGKNRRIGVGAEAWTDYLKLSANSYFGTTSWHQSRDFADYNERPANGYDLRADAYLPSHPQLGGKLMYEKYRGDEVALFGKDNRQKNPHAVTAGVNYTPFPLLTVGTEHRAGKGGQSDSSINFQFNYRLGESWQSHISPSAVAGTRTLSGSRYDLVERNNNIVLDYRKQELIRLMLPEQVTGEAGSTSTVYAQVTSKYALERIEWDSAALAAAGGKLTSVSPQAVAITLPSYQSTRSSNVHALSAVAYDSKGNASPRVSMSITVVQGMATITAANLTVTADNALANGSASNAVQARVTDANGNPVAGQSVSFTASNGAAIATATGITGADGMAVATLTSNVAGISAVTAIVNDSSQSVNTHFVADTSTATIIAGNLTVTANNVLANGTATNAVQATVTDAQGNPVAGQTVVFSANNGAAITTESVTTDASGLASTTLTSVVAGISTVTATVNGASQSVDTTFVVNDSTATLTAGNLTVTANNALSNGSATNAVQAIVTDANGNPVVGQSVSFVASNGATVTTESVTTDANGLASTTLTSTTAGVSTVTATVNGASQSVESTFVADGSTATIISGNLTVTANDALANGSATNAVQAIVTDAQGNPVAGQSVSFAASNGASLTSESVTTNASGLASTTLTSITAGVSTVTATVNGASQSVETTFVADGSTATIISGSLTVTADNAIANGSATNAVQALVTDANGNPVAGQTVVFSANNGATVTTESVTTDASGLASTTLTSTTAGVATVTATVNGGSQSVDTTFVADGSTATIISGNLTVTADNAIANGSATNAVQALVTDANGNPVAGQSVSFAASNGATVTTESVTTDANGLASTTLTSTTAGVATVTATVNGASQSVETTFVADGSTATIISGNLTVTANDALANGSATNAVQAIVTDAQGNPVAGQSVSFAASNGATVTTESVATDANGLASTTLTSTTAGVATVTATVNGSSQSVDTTFVVPAFTGVSVNGHIFGMAEGFPSTGFTGAKFALSMSGVASDYIWDNGGSSWVTVDDSGNVAFTAKGNSTPVTITATPKMGGAPLTYTFSVNTWFINNGSTAMPWSDASNWCAAQGLTQPTRGDMTMGLRVRGLGSLFSEWGSMGNYSGAGFVNLNYWASDQGSSGSHYGVALNYGSVSNYYDTNRFYVVCRQGL
ncbi:YrIlm family inverse autotransporter adhesin [Edaphovirga cremea]|uniref:YrIlm family inverse autotransporter adhesin n=1 Tax=Edaphovirga cremea TaxID=2267246 RepID=UPI003988BB9B